MAVIAAVSEDEDAVGKCLYGPFQIGRICIGWLGPGARIRAGAGVQIGWFSQSATDFVDAVEASIIEAELLVSVSNLDAVHAWQLDAGFKTGQFRRAVVVPVIDAQAGKTVEAARCCRDFAGHEFVAGDTGRRRAVDGKQSASRYAGAVQLSGDGLAAQVVVHEEPHGPLEAGGYPVAESLAKSRWCVFPRARVQVHVDYRNALAIDQNAGLRRRVRRRPAGRCLARQNAYA